MNLREWLVLYVKHKDLAKRSLISVTEQPDHVTFTFKDGVVLGYAFDSLEVPKNISGKAIIACLHTPANVETLIKRWKDFCSHPDVTVIFANPYKNEKVIIHTRTHDSVSDGDVALGIRALAEGVTYV